MNKAKHKRQNALGKIVRAYDDQQLAAQLERAKVQQRAAAQMVDALQREIRHRARTPKAVA
jgi:hypothetical protein